MTSSMTLIQRARCYYRYVCLLVLGFASIIALSLILPQAADAYLPVTRPQIAGVPATIGGPPVYDGGYRAWQQTRIQHPWYKRHKSLQPLIMKHQGTSAD
jgi:hypothetical protein